MIAEQLAAAQVLERLADHFPGRTARGRVQALRRAAEALRRDRGTTGALAAVQSAYGAPRGR